MHTDSRVLLVKERELNGALDCLRRNLGLEVDEDSSDGDAAKPEERLVDVPTRHTPSPSFSDAESAGSPGNLRLERIPGEFFLHSIPASDIDRVMRSLIDILFIRPRCSAFLSFAAVDDQQYSLIVDRQTSTLLPGGTIQQWTALKVLGEWGWSETGLALALSKPLANIAPLYLSTFSRDFVIIETALADSACSALSAAGIDVI